MRSPVLRMCFLAAGSLLAFSLNSHATVAISGGGSGPDCSHAAASEGVIWPPNHSMVAESIVGVTDPYQSPLTITITGIEQDEPVEVHGSGNTEPDGSGVGTPIAYVRAERAGGGTGRLYFISFQASVLSNVQCSGMVEVYVPHDLGQGFVPTDTGQRYDSTQAVD